MDLGIEVLHRGVSVRPARHAHKSRRVHLATRARNGHLLGKVWRDATGLGTRLAWIMSHAGSHVVARGHVGVRLLHATRVRLESLWDACHHFESRQSAAQRLLVLLLVEKVEEEADVRRWADAWFAQPRKDAKLVVASSKSGSGPMTLGARQRRRGVSDGLTWACWVVSRSG